METARQKYKELTGAEPKNLVVLGEETSRKLAEQFAEISGNLGYAPASREMEFIKVKRTNQGYFVRLIDVHRRPKGHYSGVNLNLGHVLLEEVGPAIKGLSIGDSATYCLKGKSISEIIRKRSSYIHGREQPLAQGRLDTVLSGEHLTEKQLIQNSSFEVRGNDRNGYVVHVQVRNQLGIHGRPATLIVNTAKKYDCDVMVKKNGEPVSAKSIMGVLTLDMPKGTNAIFEANGTGARECLEEVVGLFERKFDEE